MASAVLPDGSDVAFRRRVPVAASVTGRTWRSLGAEGVERRLAAAEQASLELLRLSGGSSVRNRLPRAAVSEFARQGEGGGNPEQSEANLELLLCCEAPFWLLSARHCGRPTQQIREVRRRLWRQYWDWGRCAHFAAPTDYVPLNPDSKPRTERPSTCRKPPNCIHRQHRSITCLVAMAAVRGWPPRAPQLLLCAQAHACQSTCKHTALEHSADRRAAVVLSPCRRA